MPYVLISTQIRLENGPTMVGDEWSDPKLMEFLGATLIQQTGNNFKEYRANVPPRIILDKLETIGYNVVCMTGVGQTCIWTLHKPDSKNGNNNMSESESNCDDKNAEDST